MKLLSSLVLVYCLMACTNNHTPSPVETVGGEKTSKDKLLNAGADLLQKKTPLKKFDSYLNGFHFYNGNLHAQMEAHHYVSQLSDDLYQAIIFDGNDETAKLMGVEYIITEKLFSTLAAEEKKLWHSHRYEVKSGALMAPAVPEKAELELMEKLVATYGKTIHTWHTDQQRTLPIGAPMLMMGFTKDGQIQQELINARDQRFERSTAESKKKRNYIAMPTVDSLADSWQTGTILQYILTNNADSAKHKH